MHVLSEEEVSCMMDEYARALSVPLSLEKQIEECLFRKEFHVIVEREAARKALVQADARFREVRAENRFLQEKRKEIKRFDPKNQLRLHPSIEEQLVSNQFVYMFTFSSVRFRSFI